MATPQTHDQRPAPGELNAALGRTSRDLATNEPASHGPEPIIGTDEDTFSGNGGDQIDAGAVTHQRTNPDIPPDERLGLHPTIKKDAAPDVPVNKELYGV